MKFCIVFLLLSLITSALFACSPSDRFSAGKPVSREELSEIAAGIFGTEISTRSETETKTESEIKPETPTETESETESDFEIESEIEIETESETEMETGVETETTSIAVDSTVLDTDSETTDACIVYWTPNGKVYHTNPDCRYIQGSANLQSGTIEESGKEKLCSACPES